MRTWSGTTPGAVHYYALDLPGNNVNGLFNGSGSVTHKYSYTPWGQAQSTSEGTFNPLRYASRELDATTGLYYNRARWYDPYLGRFISEDPIGIDGGINLYAYAGNDPVNFTDPMGLTCVGQIYTENTTCKLAPFRIRAPGWLRRAWDAAQRMRRWGGLSEGRGPTSIMGAGTVVENADDEMDLLEEAVDAAAEALEDPACRRAVIAAGFNTALDVATLFGPGLLARFGKTALQVGKVSRAQRHSRSAPLTLSMPHHVRFWGLASVHTTTSLTIDGMENAVVDGDFNLSWTDVIVSATPGLNAGASSFKAGQKCNLW